VRFGAISKIDAKTLDIERFLKNNKKKKTKKNKKIVDIIKIKK
jgi:hypothetical protein